MVNGISTSNQQAYKNEIKKNNLKHGIAAAATGWAAGEAIFATIKHPDNKIIKAVDNGLTKGTEYLANGGLKETYNKTAGYVKEGYQSVKKHMPDMPDFKKTYNNLPKGIQEVLNKAQEGIKTLIGKVKEHTKGLSNIKTPLKEAWNALKTCTSELLKKFAKLPAKYKVGGAIGVVTLIIANAISNSKIYNEGKIDAKYGK